MFEKKPYGNHAKNMHERDRNKSILLPKLPHQKNYEKMR
jgi:hypothetical protein